MTSPQKGVKMGSDNIFSLKNLLPLSVCAVSGINPMNHHFTFETVVLDRKEAIKRDTTSGWRETWQHILLTLHIAHICCWEFYGNYHPMQKARMSAFCKPAKLKPNEI